jgi:hydroxyacylglutathione hydrolase
MKIAEEIYLIGGSSFGLSHGFDSNVYAVDCGDEFVMIDAGAGLGSARIIENIKGDGLDITRLSRIILTHSHSDHAGGAASFKDKYGCQVCVSEAEADFVEKGDDKDFALDIAKRSGLYSPDYSFQNCKISVRLKNKDRLKCGNKNFTIIHIPGHSKGSVALVVDIPGGKAIFTGDSVSADGVICLLNCEGSSLFDYRKNIDRLSNLDIDMLFPGHGAFTLIDGQNRLDIAVKDLKLLAPPKNFI